MALGTTNISTTLVGNTIGVGSHDFDTLCTAISINKWSKWKPVRYNTLTGITPSQLYDSNYGIYRDYKTTIESFIDYVSTPLITEQGTNGFQSLIAYLKPRGILQNEPYRIGDFRNYNHLAESPWRNLTIGYEFPENENPYIYASIDINKTSSDYILTDNDILTTVNGESNWVFGINIQKVNAINPETLVNKGWLTSESAGTATIKFPINGFSEGLYYLYPFTTNVPKPTLSYPESEYKAFVDLCIDRKPINITFPDITITLNLSWFLDNRNNGTIICDYTIYNNTDNPITLSDCRILFRLDSSAYDDPLIFGVEDSKNLGNVTIQANSSISGISQGDVDITQSTYWKVWFISDSPYTIRRYGRIL